METSSEILVVAGTIALTYGLLLGIAMARARMASPSAPRHLVTTHLEALMAGPALLGLSLAADYSSLSSGLEQFAAWLFAAGVALSLGGGTANWLTSTGDPFAEKPPGFFAQAIGGPLMVLGGLLIAIGVLKEVLA